MNRWAKIAIFSFLGVGILALAFFLRYDRKTLGPDEVTLTGESAYYHARHISYCAENFPNLMGHDPLVNFPDGSYHPWGPGVLFFYACLCKMSVAQTAGERERVLAWAPLGIGLCTLLFIFLMSFRLFGFPCGMITTLLFALLPAHVHLSKTGYLNQEIMAPFALAFFFFLFAYLVFSEKILLSALYGLLAGAVAGSLPYLVPASFPFLLIPPIAHLITTFRQTRDGEWKGSTQTGYLLYFIVSAAGSFYLLSTLPNRVCETSFDLYRFYAYFSLSLSFLSVVLSATSFFLVKKERISLRFSLGLMLEFLLATIFFIALFPGASKAFGPDGILVQFFPGAWGRPWPEIFDRYTWLFPLAIPALVFVSIDGVREKKGEHVLFLAMALSSALFSSLSPSYESFFGGMIFLGISWLFVWLLKRFESRIVQSVCFLFPVLLLALSFYFSTPSPCAYLIPSKNLESALSWMKENLSFFDDKGNPTTAVLAPPRDGDWIVYHASLPTVANSKPVKGLHDQGRKKWAYFALAREEKKIFASFAKINIRYFLVPAEIDEREALEITGKTEGNAQIDAFSRKLSLNSRENEIYLPPTSHFRLLFAVPPLANSPYKIFEIVEGAVIQGKTHPESVVRVTLPLTIEVGDKREKITYQIHPKANFQGFYKTNLPYCTDKGMGKVRASAKVYDVFNAGEIKTLPVEEEKTRGGKSSTINFIKE